MVPSALGEFIAAPTLADGDHTAIAKQGVDESNALAFSVDTAAPPVEITAPAGFVAAAPAVTGTAPGAATVTVRVLQGGADIVAPATVAVAGDAWSAPLPGLAPGSYSVQATATDAAGERREPTHRTSPIDTTAPGVSAALPAGSTASTQPVIGGAAGNAAGDAELVAVLVRGPDDGVVLEPDGRARRRRLEHAGAGRARAGRLHARGHPARRRRQRRLPEAELHGALVGLRGQPGGRARRRDRHADGRRLRPGGDLHLGGRDRRRRDREPRARRRARERDADRLDHRRRGEHDHPRHHARKPLPDRRLHRLADEPARR